ncbi:MAG: heavy metal translocating P-type ATPase [Elusimicrobiota bacterium]
MPKDPVRGGNKKIQKAVIAISGMHCVSCALNIENVLKKSSGVIKAQVNFANEKAYIDYDQDLVTIDDLEKLIDNTGYQVIRPPSINQQIPNPKAGNEDNPEKTKEINRTKIKFLLSSLLCIPLLYLSMGPHFGLPIPVFTPGVLVFLQFLLTTPIIVAGCQFYTRGIFLLIKTKAANMDTLVAMGTGSAYLYSLFVSLSIWSGGSKYSVGNLYYETAGALIAFILLGNWLEARAKGKASAAIKKLAGLQPKTALALRNGREEEIAIDQVIVGEIIVVKPGQKIPVDGEILDGYSTVDESMVTGESMPVDKKEGSKIIGGKINKTGTFNFLATKIGRDTALAQIIQLVEEAQGSKAEVQKLADRISAYFVPSVALIAAAAFVSWLLAGQSFSFALTVFIAVLVIACPCALGLATPTAVMVSTGVAAQKGILIKNAQAIQLAEKIDLIVFDKTGTITRGEPEVTDFFVRQGDNTARVLLLTASLENRSEHPLAKAVLDYARGQNVQPAEISDFNIFEGRGVIARIISSPQQGAGQVKSDVVVGKKEFLLEQKVNLSPELEKQAWRLADEGKTLIWVAENYQQVGIIAVADIIKEHSAEAVRRLKKLGKQVLMITGDNQKTAEAMAKEAGIEKVIAGVLPQDKAEEIKKLKAAGLKVAMVGDGINDAPSLAMADLGIALGSGTDVAMESANIVLIKDDLRDVVTAMALSRYTMRKIKQNLFWAFFYNLIGLPIAAGLLYPFTGFLLNPMIAGAAMSFSSVSVVINSLAIKRYK